MLNGVKQALVISPHLDDETLGCGGTLKRLSVAGAKVCVLTVAGPRPPLYAEEVLPALKEDASKAHAALGVGESIFLDLPATMVAATPHHELNDAIHTLVARLRPELIFIPFKDRMIDHQTIFDSAMVATRPIGAGARIRVLAAYEVISETFWTAPAIEANFVPNWFVDISEHLAAKLEAMACYKTMVHPFPEPRSLEALQALALLRGSTVSLPYAEGFQVIRQVT